MLPRGRTKDVRNFPYPALLGRIPQRYGISVAHEFLRGKKNLTRHLSNLDLMLSELAARDTAEKIVSKNVEIRAQKKELKLIPEVVLWKNELTAVKDRKKFLVLSGPSQLGKPSLSLGCLARAPRWM